MIPDWEGDEYPIWEKASQNIIFKSLRTMGEFCPKLTLNIQIESS